MNREKGYAVFGRYLAGRRKMLLLFLACAGIFALIFSLYDLEMEAVLYAGALSLLLLFLVLAADFFCCLGRHRRYEEILRNLPLTPEELPRGKTVEEQDLQKLFLELSRLGKEAETLWEDRRQESLDYYTTWVHQIKTPISVIRMILAGEDTEEYRELSAELFRIEQYVEMVLSYLRLCGDSSDYVFQEYDLDSIIRQAVHKYAPLFVRRKLKLSYTPVQVRVLTDEKWLLFILEQLLSNSIKYTPEGSITIEVTPDKILKISDTGIGIAAEDLPRIFEKGFTGYNGRADKKSTGLGLYLCKKAADRLSHGLTVQSEPGAGTTVFLDLHTEKLSVE